MPIETLFEKIAVTEKSGEAVARIKAECKTDIPSAEIEKVLSENARCFPVLDKISEGRADFTVKVAFFVCYKSAEGVKKFECGAEIRDAVLSSLITERSDVRLSCAVEKTEVSLSGVKTAVSARITVTAEIFSRQEYSALTGGQGLFTEKRTAETLLSVPCSETFWTAEEEFDIPYPVAEVLCHRAEAVTTAVQCGVGTIICDGEIYLNEILLQTGEKQDIIRESKVIPFRVECECESAMPNFSATGNARVKTLKTDVSVDEEKKTSVLTATVTLGVHAQAFIKSETELVTDAFCTEKEITLTKKTVCHYVKTPPACAYVRLTGKGQTDTGDGDRIVTVLSERAEVVSAEKKGESLAIACAINAQILFCDKEGALFVKTVDIPAETQIKCETEGDIKVAVAVKNCSAKTIGGETECEAETVFTVYGEKTEKTEIVTAAEEGEEKPINGSAISVYIPAEGETLWELAKRLNFSPESVVSTNPELQFPLTGKERIVIYRRK